VPHISQSLWQALGHNDIPLDAPWPSVDESALKRSSIEIVVQVNGKVRDKVQAPVDAERDDVEALALAQENVQRFIDGATVRKVIVVPNKLVNIVAN
jgi:leucyl-tRNA synthetase